MSKHGIHRFLTNHHLWSPWKLIPNLVNCMVATNGCARHVIGDCWFEPRTNKTYRIESPNPPLSSEHWNYIGDDFLASEWPAANLVWRWDRRRLIYSDEKLSRMPIVPIGHSLPFAKFLTFHHEAPRTIPPEPSVSTEDNRNERAPLSAPSTENN